MNISQEINWDSLAKDQSQVEKNYTQVVDDLPNSDTGIKDYIPGLEKVSGIKNTSSNSNNKSDSIIRLQVTFRKNSYFYRILERNEKVALLEMSLRNKCTGFEVCNIRIVNGDVMGKPYPKREILPSDSQFGLEGSKSFFPTDLDNARKYFRS